MEVVEVAMVPEVADLFVDAVVAREEGGCGLEEVDLVNVGDVAWGLEARERMRRLAVRVSINEELVEW